MTNKRVTVYDWVRLLATVFVVIGHSVYLSNTTTYGSVFYSLPEAVHPLYGIFVGSTLERLRNWVYGFHMGLFFILSGAVLALRPLPSFIGFVKSKAKRLLLPYFVWGLLFMIPVKLGVVLGAPLLSQGLAAINYTATMEITDAVKMGILNTIAMIPAVVQAIALLFYILYPLSNKKMTEVLAANAERDAAAKTA